MGRAIRKRVLEHRRTASAQSDQGLRCPQTEPFDSIECFSGEQCPDKTAHVQDDVNQHILRMPEETFSPDTVQMA